MAAGIEASFERPELHLKPERSALLRIMSIQVCELLSRDLLLAEKGVDELGFLFCCHGAKIRPQQKRAGAFDIFEVSFGHRISP